MKYEHEAPMAKALIKTLSMSDFYVKRLDSCIKILFCGKAARIEMIRNIAGGGDGGTVEIWE